ncbi:hypothetical protein BpHYR1_018089 [Brachionus plicatilis]|uniref:Uncharacterized protein n=1 Tax=Brachionus plicatilis TaxID=10195 RepID=A0A3M7Q7P4_BRAPC|nr:hypothetical protein BpHYR1_018089 [Brachionus plicatilis]
MEVLSYIQLEIPEREYYQKIITRQRSATNFHMLVSVFIFTRIINFNQPFLFGRIDTKFHNVYLKKPNIKKIQLSNGFFKISLSTGLRLVAFLVQNNK